MYFKHYIKSKFYLILLSLVLTFNLSYGNEKIPIEQLKAFSEVYMKIKKDYVEKVDDEKLFDDAIKGMLEGLDPHSTYLNEKDFEDLQIGTRGEFGGLGIEVTMEDGYVKVVSPIDDTPAYRAGVKAGDLIIMLDDKPVKGLTLSECVDIMRGKVGTSLELTIAREGENKPLKIKNAFSLVSLNRLFHFSLKTVVRILPIRLSFSYLFIKGIKVIFVFSF